MAFLYPERELASKYELNKDVRKRLTNSIHMERRLLVGLALFVLQQQPAVQTLGSSLVQALKTCRYDADPELCHSFWQYTTRGARR